jgi:sporulation protein YlmC with PRC-barrel domain
MTVKASRLYGLDIYNADGAYVGKVHDLIVNLEEGQLVRMTTEPLRTLDREQLPEVMQKKSILYKRVKSVQDIVLIGRD